MATREEIREGVFKVLFPHSNADHYTGDGTVQKVLEYLHSQGVVLKGERAKSPDDLVATEPLIEDKPKTLGDVVLANIRDQLKEVE